MFFLLLSSSTLPSEAGTLFDPDVDNRVRIAEYANDPAAQVFLMRLIVPFQKLDRVKPVWQTLNADILSREEDLLTGVLEAHDLIFTSDEEFVRGLLDQGLLRESHAIYLEELILVGPPSLAPQLTGLSALDVLKQIFSGQQLFFSLMHNPWVESLENRLWKEAGIIRQGDNKYYVESGQDDIGALIQASDEGGFMLIGTGSFGQYQNAIRGMPLLQKIAGTNIYRTHYACTTSKGASRKQREATVDKYIKWLRGENGRAFINGFVLGEDTPYQAAQNR